MNKPRLQLVVDTLRDKVSDEEFDITLFYAEGDCGCAGCAVGHYVVHNPDDGLSLRDGNVVNSRTGNIGFPAISEHFCITRGQSDFLFLREAYDDYPSRSTVISRIQEYIDSDGQSAKGEK